MVLIDYIAFVRKNAALALGRLDDRRGPANPHLAYAQTLGKFNQDVLFSELDLMETEFYKSRRRLGRSIDSLCVALRMSVGRPYAVFIVNQFFF